MLFNPGRKYDFMPRIKAPDGNFLEVTEQFKLLGVVIRTDLKWCDNTDYIYLRAMKKMWMLRNLKQMGGTEEDVLDVYFKHVRSIAEYAVPVWNFSLTKKEVIKLERIQKIGVAIIKGENYNNYKTACSELNILTLQNRRKILCEKMASKSAEDETFKGWFCENKRERSSRHPQSFFKPVPYRKEAFGKSPIPKFTEIGNSMLSQD